MNTGMEGRGVPKSCLIMSVGLTYLALSCTGAPTTYSSEVVDGITHIYNEVPIWGDEPRVKLEFVQKIGELDPEDQEYEFYRLRDIVRDSLGNLYFLDAGNHRIQKFDSDGGFLASFGREGTGPGEFKRPSSLEIDSEGNLYVCDVLASRVSWIQVLSPAGEELKRFQLPPLSDEFWLTRAGGIITLAYGQIEEETGAVQDGTSLLQFLTDDGSPKREFGEVITIEQDGEKYSPNGFSLAFDSHDHIYLAFSNQNRIDKYDASGGLIWRADRPIPYELTYGNIVERKVEVLGRMMTIELPDDPFVSGGIGIDYRDRIWVRTYKKQKSEGDRLEDYLEFEIFDVDGLLLGRLPIPRLGNISIFGDRIFFLDSQEEMAVFEYRIVDR